MRLMSVRQARIADQSPNSVCPLLRCVCGSPLCASQKRISPSCPPEISCLPSGLYRRLSAHPLCARTGVPRGSPFSTFQRQPVEAARHQCATIWASSRWRCNSSSGAGARAKSRSRGCTPELPGSNRHHAHSPSARLQPGAPLRATPCRHCRFPSNVKRHPHVLLPHAEFAVSLQPVPQASPLPNQCLMSQFCGFFTFATAAGHNEARISQLLYQWPGGLTHFIACGQTATIQGIVVWLYQVEQDTLRLALRVRWQILIDAVGIMYNVPDSRDRCPPTGHGPFWLRFCR